MPAIEKTYSAVKKHSGTEDGYLYYVQDSAGNEPDEDELLPSGFPSLIGGWSSQEDAAELAAEFNLWALLRTEANAARAQRYPFSRVAVREYRDGSLHTETPCVSLLCEPRGTFHTHLDSFTGFGRFETACGIEWFGRLSSSGCMPGKRVDCPACLDTRRAGSQIY